MSGIVFLDGLNCLCFMRIMNCKIFEMKNDFHQCAELLFKYAIKFNLSLTLVCSLFNVLCYIFLQQLEKKESSRQKIAYF